MNELTYLLLFAGGIASLLNGNYWLLKRRDSILEEIQERNKILISSYDSIDTIDKILEKTQIIQSLFQKLKNSLPFFEYFYSKEIYTEQRKIYKDELHLMSNFLIDLVSDFQIRLSEEKRTVQKTKRNVQKNLYGTTRLDEVSKLQQLRLEKQIEEFEKLEKILVKI